MTIDIERVVTYPTNSDEWIKTVAIGGVLALLSVFIIPIFLLYGYLLRVLRAGIAEADEPPVFDDWGRSSARASWRSSSCSSTS